jgi:subtilisin family serine protease
MRTQQGRGAYFRVLSFLFMAMMLAGPMSGAALAQGSPVLRSKAVAVDSLLAKAADPEGVRVIVTLNGVTGGDQILPVESSSTQQVSSPTTSGPLRDGQGATVEQAQIVASHLGADDAKRRRWSPRLIRNTPYMAMTVTQAELEALAADSTVVSIHEDGRLQPGLQDSVPLIGMGPAYNVGATGSNTMVVIVDTGVDYDHVFTTPRVTNATCFSGSEGVTSSLCPNGQTSQFGGSAGRNCGLAGCEHGTHVAGIAAGNRASGTPLNGVAKAAVIFASQVFSRTSNNTLTARDSDILASLQDLLARVSPGGELSFAHVTSINLSLGDHNDLHTGSCDTGRGAPFKTVIDSFRTNNIAVVIAAGNDSQTNQTSFPGCVSTAVTVSNSTKTDTVGFDSNISTVTDLFAPGSNITSSVPPTPNFAVMSGTSMAAPHVTGAFAAIRSACPSATVGQIEDALKSTGTPITDNRSGGTFTKPRIRVDLAVQQACNGGLVGQPTFRLAAFGVGAGGWTSNDTYPRVVADVNGDGKADIVGFGYNGVYVSLATGGGGFAPPQLVLPAFGVGAGGWTSNDTYPRVVADVDGDGKADIVAFSYAGVYVALATGGGGFAST